VIDPIGLEGEITATLVDLSETGIGFLTDDVVEVGWSIEIALEAGTVPTAQVEVVRRGPGDPRRFGGRFVDAERGRRVVAAAEPRPAAGEPGDAMAAPRPSVSASATSVAVGGVLTIGHETSVSLASPVREGRRVALVAPRGQVPAGACFAVRYLTQAGAMRALVRADVVSPQPGMVDGIEATLLRPPTPAAERAHHRAAFDRFFTAELATTGGTVTGRLLDLSAGGVGFRLNRGLVVGDRLRFADAGLGDLDGAESIVVRRDPRDRQRFGARFVEPERGAHVLETILHLDRAAREHRRQVDARTARHRGAAAMQPLTESDVRRIRSQRMRTREPGAP
jgi:hypothetical protein